MNLINFKSKNILKNLKRALKASEHIQNGEKITFNLNETIFPRNKFVNQYIDLIVLEIMELEIIHNNFSKIYIEKNILSILENLNSKRALTLPKQDFNDLCLELLNKFENEIKNIIDEDFDDYVCIFHIANLKLIKPITIGEVILFPLKNMDKKLKKYNEDIFGADFFREEEVYAKTLVYGSKEFAHSKAQNNIKITLNMLKLLLPEKQCNFNLDGDVFSPNYRQYVMFASDNEIASGVKLEGSIFHCEFTEEKVDSIRHELNILSTLFYKKNKSDFENRLITAIYWFGEAISIKMNEYKKIGNKHQSLIDNFEFFNAYPKLLYLVIALETVFVFDNNESKSEAVSSKVSTLIAKPEYKNDIKKFLKYIYDIRSSIVHSGIDYISKEDLARLTKYTRLALFNIILINYNFNNEIRKLQQRNS